MWHVVVVCKAGIVRDGNAGGSRRHAAELACERGDRRAFPPPIGTEYPNAAPGRRPRPAKHHRPQPRKKLHTRLTKHSEQRGALCLSPQGRRSGDAGLRRSGGCRQRGCRRRHRRVVLAAAPTAVATSPPPPPPPLAPPTLFGPRAVSAAAQRARTVCLAHDDVWRAVCRPRAPQRRRRRPQRHGRRLGRRGRGGSERRRGACHGVRLARSGRARPAACAPAAHGAHVRGCCVLRMLRRPGEPAAPAGGRKLQPDAAVFFSSIPSLSLSRRGPAHPSLLRHVPTHHFPLRQAHAPRTPPPPMRRASSRCSVSSTSSSPGQGVAIGDCPTPSCTMQNPFPLLNPPPPSNTYPRRALQTASGSCAARAACSVCSTRRPRASAT